MKVLTATIVAAALLSASPVLAAETADLSKLTCADFTKYDDNNRGLIMMWLEGYYTEEDEPATIDFGKMAGHLAQLLIDCQANPDKKMLDAADEAMDN
ncbi:MAG: hypothetical protein JJE37_00820 [Methyloceanibacter sp.]|jgi:acid stress chaperone HdeB|nr:hypothetical protein [Methyloceanibacter sp.]